jgi:phosphoribosylamine--glycine ligase
LYIKIPKFYPGIYAHPENLMKILVIGSGGREHALVWKIAQSPLVGKIYCAPGNAGTTTLAENIPVAAADVGKLLSFAVENQIDLTVVGPEDPLVEGIVDEFEKRDLRIFGPGKSAARLEGSKVFAKNLMQKYGIPTATYAVFEDYKKAINYLNKNDRYPVVLKASGLAAGKGVLICASQKEALESLRALMEDKIFGGAAAEVVIEEYLEGEELSLFAICDGVHYVLLSSSQDHKKALDGDKGKNTGGMGAYAPAPLANDGFIKRIRKEIIEPTLSAIAAEAAPYKGVLYLGLMVSNGMAKVLEYNCRFGDPETEVVLPLLKSDLVPILLASVDGTLDRCRVEMYDGWAVDVVLASGGYPDKYEKEKVIGGLEKLPDDILIFHAGTKLKNGNIVTSGGRVLNIVARGDSFTEAQSAVYNHIKKINFDAMHYRKDIGFRAIKHLRMDKE